MQSKKIINLATPTNDYDSATKKYVDDSISSGGSSYSVTNKTADATLTSSECDGFHIISNSGATSDITLTLPTASAGQKVIIVNASSSYEIVVKSGTSDYIVSNNRQVDTFYLNQEYGTMNLNNVDDTNWVINNDTALTSLIPQMNYLKHYWNLNSNLIDQKGSNDLTNNGATDTTGGVIGNCLSFDGSNDYLSLTEITLPTDFSISMWVKFDSTSSQQILISGTTAISLNFYIPDSDRFMIMNDGSGYLTFTGCSWSTGVWTHIVLTREGNECKVYKNGALIDTQTSSSNATMYISKIGQYDNNYYLAGDLDEVMIYYYILKQSDVTALYNSGNGVGY